MWIFIVELIFSLGLFVNAVLFVPQIFRLYKTKDNQGLSLITFFGFVVIQFFTCLHGYIKEDYILMLGYFLSLITCGTVTFMIVFYRMRSNKLS